MSTPQPQMGEPPMTAAYGQSQSPGQAWGPPAMGQQYVPPARSAMSPKTGHVFVLIGNLIVAAGVIFLGFSASTITFGMQDNPDPELFSFGIGAIFLTLGALLVGVGFLIRSFGAYMVAVMPAIR